MTAIMRAPYRRYTVAILALVSAPRMRLGESMEADGAAGLPAAAWRDHRPIEALRSACRPQTIDDGYAVQGALVRVLGYVVIGFKIGATSSYAQAFSEVDQPLFGPLVMPSRHHASRRAPHPNEARLAGAILLEQNDEWAVQRARSMTLETIAPLRDDLTLMLPAAAA